MLLEEQDRLCKICLERESDHEKIPDCYPCRCTGSLKYVHSSCLEMWLKTTSTKQCELCLYKYKFKNIYRKDTPEQIGVLVVVHVLARRLVALCCNTLRIAFSVILRLLVVYTTSVYYSLLFLSPEGPVSEYHFFNGPLLVCIAMGVQSLKRCVAKKLDMLKKRRVILNRLGGRGSAEGNYTPCTSVTQSETPETAYANYEGADMNSHEQEELVQEIASPATSSGNIGISYNSLGERESHVSINTPIDDPLASALSSGNDEESILSRFNIPFTTSVLSNTRWLFYNCSMISLFKMLLLPSEAVRMLLEQHSTAFFDFLSEHNLKDLFCNLAGLLSGMLHLILVLRHIPALREHYTFAKVIFFLYYELFVSTALLGMLLNYAFFRFFDFRNFLFDSMLFKRPLLLFVNGSVLLNYATGLLAMFLLTIPVLALKKIYRPGALFFLRNASDFDIIKKILTSDFWVLLCNQLLVSAAYVASIVATIYTHKGILQSVSFEIGTYKKLLIYAIVSFVIFVRLKALSAFLGKNFHYVLLALCRAAGCEDYFFGIKRQDAERAMLRWCPNRDMKYSRRERLARFSRSFSDEELAKFYTERSSEHKYALYHIPAGFSAVRRALDATQGVWEQVVPSDVQFLLGIVFVLSAVQMLYKVCLNLRCRTSLSGWLDKVNDSIKVAVIHIFRIFIWPTIASVVVLNSLGVHDTLKAEKIFLYCIIDIFLVMVIVTHIIAEIIRVIGLFPTIEVIPLFELLRKLIFVTSLNVGIVLITTLYEAVVIKKAFAAGYGHVYLIMGLMLVFIPFVFYYSFLVLRRMVFFVRNIKEELFLERRQAMNYGE
ncbi:UNVERIFIED_CONTAM: hypothetical protein PYX00_011425 [Menopon gallinae]|uniref:RING-type E3 ubiquitin transferase n=1 Tax=Menopon gallinae TaxID=328185 RepID=A0AAW2H7J6_9NEOP